MSNKIDSSVQEVSNLPAPAKKLYNDELQAELLELQTDTELLFRQLQSLSRQRLALAESGSN
jgi:hypothetical protein